jgi:branched-chain amino acid transport system ATP-binding protein
MRDVLRAVRHPRQWLRDVCAGEAVFPLVVLFGLNAVDELDRTAFGILLPEIRESFGLDLTGALAVVALSAVAALALQVPIAQHADRARRVPLVIAGALVWAVFSGLTGLAWSVAVLVIARSGSAVGKAVIDPTHNSLIADWYPLQARNRVYSVHRAANATGAFVGPLVAGLLAYSLGWRAPFLLFVIPTLVFVLLALRLREPVRGKWEREAAGADHEVAHTEEAAPSFAESWRTVQKVPSLRRLWWSLPFLATALIGFVTLAALMYDQEFGLNERQRGVAAAITEPFQLAGIIIGSRIIARRYVGDLAGLLRFLGSIAIVCSIASVAFAFAPNVVIAVGVNCILSGSLAALGPGILGAFSLAIPPRARATGFSMASLWVIPGLVVLPFIGWVAEEWNIRVGLLVMLPLFFIGSLILRSVSGLIVADVTEVWRSTAARSEAVVRRRQGLADLLLVRRLDASYGDRQVLFGIDLDVKEGEVVALLGTNGAGKSTLLRAISGVLQADRGAVVLDGRDITHAPPNEIAALGIAQVPGGIGIFPSLTVDEHLQLAGWTRHRDRAGVRAATAEVLELFPALQSRLHDPAGNLSGGQQQMLALGMALIARPRVLLIDELSLGLAPMIVGQLLTVVRRLAEEGVAVVLVEQSVNVAVEAADRAYFLERGTIRFSGPTSELLARPDLLRSVFLTGAADGGGPDRSVHHAPVSLNGDGVPALEVSGLTRSFGGIRAVDGVSLIVRPAEIVGVIGPNGAGKTTAFDLISGFVPADAGTVHIGGVDVTSCSAAERAARGLGRSFQDARLFPELTVEETLAVALERWIHSRGVLAAAVRLPSVYDDEARTAARVSELVELMGLGEHRNSFVRELSTGTRRMVDLACQLAHRPTVILLDEPSSGIAQREVEALGPVMERIRGEMGAALVVIEHDIPLVSAVADRLIALDQGRVIADGDPAAVLAHETVVESYLGTSGAAIARSGERR